MAAVKKKTVKHTQSSSRLAQTAFSLTGFGFQLVALAACGVKKLPLLPLICGIISRQQASTAGGMDVT